MTIPGQTFSSKTSSPTTEYKSRSSASNLPSRHATRYFIGNSCNPPAVFKPPATPVSDAAHLASTEKTRAALLKLCESPRDSFALATWWDENRCSIEYELRRHLHSDSNSPLLQQLLARLVWHARFFCDELDHPKAWIARCANLEARRLALQLIRTQRIRIAAKLESSVKFLAA